MQIDFSDLHRACGELTAELEGDVMAAMGVAARLAKEDLRRQTLAAGLGQNIANAWRDRVYPERARSMEPSAYVHSRAPKIAEGFLGATIRPVNGGRYLWIPTRSVPRSGGRRRRLMTPEEVSAQFGQDFVFRRGKKGNLLAFISRARGTTKTGKARAVRKGRTAHGGDRELVLMFTLVRSTKLRTAFDLKATAERGAANFAALMGRG